MKWFAIYLSLMNWVFYQRFCIDVYVGIKTIIREIEQILDVTYLSTESFFKKIFLPAFHEDLQK